MSRPDRFRQAQVIVGRVRLQMLSVLGVESTSRGERQLDHWQTELAVAGQLIEAGLDEPVEADLTMMEEVAREHQRVHKVWSDRVGVVEKALAAREHDFEALVARVDHLVERVNEHATALGARGR